MKTVAEVAAEVDRICRFVDEKSDDETAHAYEDKLLADVLRSIADGTAEDPAAMAREALKVGDIEFCRWYA